MDPESFDQLSSILPSGFGVHGSIWRRRPSLQSSLYHLLPHGSTKKTQSQATENDGWNHLETSPGKKTQDLWVTSDGVEGFHVPLQNDTNTNKMLLSVAAHPR